jgi:geranylgeranyl pyrophosphate synthase
LKKEYREKILELEQFFNEKKQLIEDSLNKFLSENIDAAAIGVSKYIIEGGKRVRGLLVLYVANALSTTDTKALDTAVAIELVHASSLALDDIIDMDYRRRGRPATWVAKGVSKTVLVSNLLVPLAVKQVEPMGKRAISLVIDAWLKVTKGEILDVFSDKGEYETIVHLKTASLLQLSLYLGALSAGREDLLPYLERYGLWMGTVYQAADDLVDSKTYVGKIDKPKPVTRYLDWLGFPTDSVLKWSLVYEKGLDKLMKLIENSEKAAMEIPDKTLSTFLYPIPRYLAEKMLGEGGLSLP